MPVGNPDSKGSELKVQSMVTHSTLMNFCGGGETKPVVSEDQPGPDPAPWPGGGAGAARVQEEQLAGHHASSHIH